MVALRVYRDVSELPQTCIPQNWIERIVHGSETSRVLHGLMRWLTKVIIKLRQVIDDVLD